MADRSTLYDYEIAFVQSQKVARLATSDADGHPHVVPVCFAFDGSRFYTPLDEKPKRVEQLQLRRVRNIEARHEAMLLIDRYDDDWSRLGYVQIYGPAGLLMPGEPGHALDDEPGGGLHILLMAGGAEPAALARKGQQVLVLAMLTPDAGKAPMQVPFDAK